MSAARDHRYRTGMWIFIASETLLFAGLFALFASYYDHYPVEFGAAGAHALEWVGVTMTLVLVVSSFAVASAIRLARAGRMREAALALLAAILLGAIFLTLKLYEWHAHASEGFVPGRAYASSELPGRGAALYFALYYLMTGLHALHLLGGMCLLAWVARAMAAGRVTRHRHLPLELVGLYWHFVDVVWLFLWPLFYLVHS